MRWHNGGFTVLGKQLKGFVEVKIYHGKKLIMRLWGSDITLKEGMDVATKIISEKKARQIAGAELSKTKSYKQLTTQ